MTQKPPLPPFTQESARQKVRMAEDAWNTRDPEKVSLAYTPESVWRNRSEFIEGRDAIVQFLTQKWQRELGYRLIKELWAYHERRIAVRFQYERRIAVRFQYECHDTAGQWFRCYGNEQWEFDDNGLMQRREASINDVPIEKEQRRFLWPQGPRPEDHAGLTELGM